MSYYVIRGPLPNVSHYLCVLESFPSPQWWKREEAIRFPDARSARTWLYAAKQTWADHGSYDGRVVRINTSADLKAERLRLRAEVRRLRGGRQFVLDEVEAAIMNGPIVRGGASARTLNEVVAAVRALRTGPRVVCGCGDSYCGDCAGAERTPQTGSDSR